MSVNEDEGVVYSDNEAEVGDTLAEPHAVAAPSPESFAVGLNAQG